MRSFQGLSLIAAMLYSQNVPTATAADLSIDSREDITDSAKLLAEDLMSLYKGDEPGNVPGLFPDDEYYFWQSGVFMGAMIDYWHLTGDDTYNDAVQAGILHQVGDDEDFMPANQTASLGNDDQCFWALNAMTAAETGFQTPPKDEPQWLALAKAVFEEQVKRIDDTCDGGLRWQVFSFNLGYNYKNTISAGCLMNLGARLARFTGEKKYTNTVDELWDWLSATKLIDADDWAVYDGADVAENCTEVAAYRSSNTATLLTYTAAVMSNLTNGSDAWLERAAKLSDATLEHFFPDGILVERFCEPFETCISDAFAYKGLAHRWLAATAQLTPSTADKILPVLETSAKAAVDQCTGGKSGRKCGYYWSEGEYVEPETSGANEEMDVLAAVSNLLILQADTPATSSSGGGSPDDSDGEGDNGEGDNGEGDNGDDNASGDDESTPSSTDNASESTPTSDSESPSSTPTDPSAAGHISLSVWTLAFMSIGLIALN